LPIGGVIATDTEAGELGGAISPGGVGFDINCGVRMLALDATESDIPNLKKLAGRLAGRIPAGASGKGGLDINNQQLDDLIQRGAHAAVDFGFGFDEDLAHIESKGMLHTEEAAISTRARERGLRALGTLGSGNHFLELQTVGKTVDTETAEKWGLYEGQLVAMIHSGSRGLGHQVCSDHVRALESRYSSSNGMWVEESWGYSLPDRQLAAAPFHSKEGQSYFDAMNAAANFAFANRSALAHRLREVLRLELGTDGEARVLYDVAHNIAKVEHHHIDGVECKVCVHRKGATRAFGGDHSDLTGEPVPLAAITASLPVAMHRADNRCWFPATWELARGSWPDQRRARTKPLAHLATVRVERFREQKQRKPSMAKPSNSSWKRKAFEFMHQRQTSLQKRHQMRTRMLMKS